MLAAKTRSGMVETWHDGALAVVGPEGELIASSGDIDRPFYLRSSAKPFQALVAEREGARLSPVEMAVACSSHDGHPVHVSIAEAMLEAADLDPSHLGCPPDWPLAPAAKHRLIEAGHTEPRRIWNNCSGKHAAWLRACRARGWPLSSYLDPKHPLQLAVVETVELLGQASVRPLGVDGCGAPVPTTTARTMARLYAALATDPILQPQATAMHRYPALVAGPGSGDAELAKAFPAAAKKGADGCLGLAMFGKWGIAAKCWDGSNEAAEVAVGAAIAALGAVSKAQARSLESILNRRVLGGGREVGTLEPRLELRFT